MPSVHHLWMLSFANINWNFLLDPKFFIKKKKRGCLYFRYVFPCYDLVLFVGLSFPQRTWSEEAGISTHSLLWSFRKVRVHLGTAQETSFLILIGAHVLEHWRTSCKSYHNVRVHTTFVIWTMNYIKLLLWYYLLNLWIHSICKKEIHDLVYGWEGQ